MALATWWRGDPLPELVPLTEFHATISQDISLLAELTKVDAGHIQERIAAANTPYVAYIGKEPVGYGWVANRTASIGELNLTFMLAPENRYLWDFVTLPMWRGRGVYPHLLQAILATQEQQGEHFWIIYAPENYASSTGIRKAGFVPVNELSFSVEGGAGLVSLTFDSRAQLGATLLGVPLLEGKEQNNLIPCWQCGTLRKEALCWSSTCDCLSPR